MLRPFLRKSLSPFPRLKHRLKRTWGRWNAGPDWKSLIAGEPKLWSQAQERAKTGTKVLIATNVGGFLTGSLLESALAAAVTLRGSEVHMLLCDEALPACMEAVKEQFPKTERFTRFGPQRDLCRDCFTPAAEMLAPLGVRIHRMSDWLSASDLAEAERLSKDTPAGEIEFFSWDGLKVGEHAQAGALRFFAKGTFDNEPQAEAVRRRYLRAAVLTAMAARKLFRAATFEAAVFHHGIYVPQGVIGEAARAAGVRVINWNPAYRKGRFIFSEGDTYHHTLMTEPVRSWDGIELTDAMERELMSYLDSRKRGTQDWIWFHENPKEDFDSAARKLGIDANKPLIGLLTNVIWDAQLHYPANAFASMREWIVQTIQYFASRPELQLLIRVHPAEIHGTVRSRQPAVEEIRKAFPVLPKNVFILGPENNVSTYAAMKRCSAALIYGTKMGVELASLGLPVIVAGEAWIRNKGITRDAKSAADYFNILAELPFGKDAAPVDLARARRYAYHFFFRRMIPLDFVKPRVGDPPYKLALRSLRDLLPGKDRGLDVVCGAILKGGSCVYPNEALEEKVEAAA